MHSLNLLRAMSTPMSATQRSAEVEPASPWEQPMGPEPESPFGRDPEDMPDALERELERLIDDGVGALAMGQSIEVHEDAGSPESSRGAEGAGIDGGAQCDQGACVG